MHLHRLLRHAQWQLRLPHLSHQLRKLPQWLPKQQNRLKPAFLAGSKACLVPAHRWQLHLCVRRLLLTNAKVVRMVVQAVMVSVPKVKASAVMAVALKAETHGVAVAVNAMVLSAAQSVAQSAVTMHALKVVAHVTRTARMVAAHARKPVLMLKAN